VRSEIVAPGPTVAVRVGILVAGGGGGGGGWAGGPPPVVNAPRIVVLCGSQTNVYRARSCSVTVQVTVPTVSTSVRWSTPGPARWKLCMFDWSRTSIV
jgi:hypothetical protein